MLLGATQGPKEKAGEHFLMVRFERAAELKMIMNHAATDGARWIERNRIQVKRGIQEVGPTPAVVYGYSLWRCTPARRSTRAGRFGAP